MPNLFVHVFDVGVIDFCLLISFFRIFIILGKSGLAKIRDTKPAQPQSTEEKNMLSNEAK